MQKQQFQLENGDTPSLTADGASDAWFGECELQTVLMGYVHWGQGRTWPGEFSAETGKLWTMAVFPWAGEDAAVSE